MPSMPPARQSDQIGIGALIKPFAAINKLVTKIAEVRDGAAE